MPFRPRDPRLLAAAILFLLVGLILLWLSGIAHAQERSDVGFRVAVGGYLTASAIDAGITASCLSQGRCREANPLMGPFAAKPGTLVAVKMAASGAVAVAAWKVRTRHPKAAWTIILTSAAVQCVAVAWNVRQLRGQQR